MRISNLCAKVWWVGRYFIGKTAYIPAADTSQQPG